MSTVLLNHVAGMDDFSAVTACVVGFYKEIDLVSHYAGSLSLLGSDQEDIYAALQGKVQNVFDVGDHAGNVGSRLYTRCERETLIRLPRCTALPL